MRAIWKGAVSFGLVNVPVRLYSATENHDVQFRQVHRTDGGRIRYKRFCSKDGQEVAYDDIAKGYETEDGQMIVLTDDDMAELPTRSSKEISVEKFVPEDQIDPMLLDKSYYLEPDKTATKPYVLLREALEAQGRMAIVTVSIRTRMTMAVLRVRDGVIVMQTMLWPDEIRSADFASVEDQELSDKEMSMARMLIDELAGDYDPDEFEDDYALAVEALVRAKIDGGKVQQVEDDEEESGEVVEEGGDVGFCEGVHGGSPVWSGWSVGGEVVAAEGGSPVDVAGADSRAEGQDGGSVDLPFGRVVLFEPCLLTLGAEAAWERG